MGWEGCDVLLRHGDLLLALGLRPAECVAHQLGDPRDALLGRLRVEVGEAHAQGEHVLDSHRVLVLGRVLDLRLNEGVSVVEGLADVLFGALADGKRRRAVRVAEVLRNLLRDAVLLDELHVEEGVVAIAADELDALGDAWAHLGDTTEVLLLDDTVDELLSHCTVLRTTETHART